MAGQNRTALMNRSDREINHLKKAVWAASWMIVAFRTNGIPFSAIYAMAVDLTYFPLFSTCYYLARVISVLIVPMFVIGVFANTK